MRFSTQLFAYAILLALACLASVEAKKKVLIYTYTQAYYHESIPTATKEIESLGKSSSPGFETVHSNDPADFERKDWLKQFDALVFLSISGKALTGLGAGNMRRYIEAGGGYVGIHVSCDALNDYHWYGRLVGAYFHYHPLITHATLNVVNHSHPSTSHLGKTWRVYDEMYSFKSNPSKYGKKYLLTAQEDSYDDPIETKKQRASEQGSPHPIAWWKEGNQLDYNPHVKVGGGTDPTKKEIRLGRAGTGGDGRSFYTSLGHTKSIWGKSDFQKHILGGIDWVLDSPTVNSAKSRVGSKYVATAISNATVTSAETPNTDSTMAKSSSMTMRSAGMSIVSVAAPLLTIVLGSLLR